MQDKRNINIAGTVLLSVFLTFQPEPSLWTRNISFKVSNRVHLEFFLKYVQCMEYSKVHIAAVAAPLRQIKYMKGEASVPV